MWDMLSDLRAFASSLTRDDGFFTQCGLVADFLTSQYEFYFMLMEVPHVIGPPVLGRGVKVAHLFRRKPLAR